MDANVALDVLRKTFVYRADGQLDSWRVMPVDPDGHRRGDCDDFAITLAYRLAGESGWVMFWHLLTRKTKIHYCETYGTGGRHAVLEHRGAGFACNIYPQWAPETKHRRIFRWLVPFVALKLAMGFFTG